MCLMYCVILQFKVSNMEEIKEHIKRILTYISDIGLDELCKKLSEIGVECLDDCKYLKEEDVCPPLKSIQSRKLLESWTSINGNIIHTSTYRPDLKQPGHVSRSRMKVMMYACMP